MFPLKSELSAKEGPLSEQIAELREWIAQQAFPFRVTIKHKYNLHSWKDNYLFVIYKDGLPPLGFSIGVTQKNRMDVAFMLHVKKTFVESMKTRILDAIDPSFGSAERNAS